MVGQAGSLEEARKLPELEVDVAVVDLDLPDGDGAHLIGELHEANPQAIALVLTASSDRATRARVVEEGAAEILHKSVYIRDVIEAVRRLEAGEALLGTSEVGELLKLALKQRAQDEEVRQAIGSLTRREREVMQALAEGLSDKEIAQRLYVSAGTIRNHVVHILGKLGVHSRLQALVFTVRHGVVEID